MSRLSDFPPKLRASTDHSETVYARAKDYYAWHGESGAGKPGDDVVFSLNDGQITVFKGEPKRNDADDRIGAVYNAGASLAVPTGLVFVRFSGGLNADSQREALKQAGYAIDEIPSYAPNAAWVRDVGGDIAAALTRIGALEKLAHVENVEPQLLMPRALRRLP
jgi:hypothetical protein